MTKDKLSIGSVEFNTLVAVTEDEHNQGLMFKPWPPPPMCFVFGTTEPRKFWMHNTVSPLDIIFCRANKIIAIYSGEPFSMDLIGPDEPVDFVIELPKGTVEANKISINDNVCFKYSINTLSKIYEEKLVKHNMA